MWSRSRNAEPNQYADQRCGAGTSMRISELRSAVYMNKPKKHKHPEYDQKQIKAARLALLIITEPSK